jgi:hypothetical protein
MKNKFTTILRFALTSLLCTGIIGINIIPNKSLKVLAQQTIGLTQIDSLARQTSGIQVYLRGEVTEKVPFLGRGAYALKDQTGIIWVFTDQFLPNMGEVVLIEGEIQYQSIPIAGGDIGEFYIKQVQRLDFNQYVVLEGAVAQNPIIETPIIETPIIETPIVETPIVETPIIETPIVETPIVETPIIETPIVETPIIETPIVETPIIETPIVETLISENPLVETTLIEMPNRIEAPQPAKLPFEPEFMPHK